MKILSHRGYWKSTHEKNTRVSFSRSFSHGFGLETDIRDYKNDIVISHDIPNGAEIKFIDFLKEFNFDKDKFKDITLALNIKSDGLASMVKSAIEVYPLLDYFVFDMSIPDMKTYFDRNIPVFTRMSEVEHYPAYIEKSEGVWLDSFESEWFDVEMIQKLVDMKKRVCIVSSELHGRPYMSLWKMVNSIKDKHNILLCTDFPKKAEQYFTQ
jgi:hypothetical protein